MIDTTGKPGNPNGVMAEDATPPEQASGNQDQQETASLPLSLWGETPPKEGDEVPRLMVVSVDQQAGSVNVTKAPEQQKPGSDGLAERLDQPKQEGVV
jgi:hypothetical protein